MWGQLFLETSLQQNFNFGFSTHKSDILIHLSQWQYWWWFWFSLVWVVYYYVIVTDATKRTLTFNPILNTSLRSHGKWGDFLVALIPLSWCGNILVNSNFILRIIEWQNESSLFTLRIQGKQWYWVYKYDGNAAVMVDSAPKNIGHDRWTITTSNESYCADSYYQALHLAAQLEFQDLYSIEIKKANLTKKILEAATLYTNPMFIPNTEDLLEAITLTPNNIDWTYLTNFTFKDLQKKKLSTIAYINAQLEKHLERKLAQNNWEHPSRIYEFLYKLSRWITIGDVREDAYEYLARRKILTDEEMLAASKPVVKKKPLQITIVYAQPIIEKTWAEEAAEEFVRNSHFDLLKIDDTQNTYGNMRVLLANDPVLLHCGVLNPHVIELLQSQINLKTPLLFTAQVNNTSIEPKIDQTEDLWGFRQKRYKRLKEFKFLPREYYDPTTFQQILPTDNSTTKVYTLIYNKQREINTEEPQTAPNYTGNLSYRTTSEHPYTPTTLEAQKTQTVITNNAYYYYSALRLNKKRTELLSANLARRLLRTKRTLVLPTHVNITVITNSYDVVHSWFIPGLGLKLDCVPGRSTHHTLYVDNVGFYYGQCAEICGRYHHHMPIRVCAIPFEQFLIWWHTKGLPRTLRLHQNKLNLPKTITQQPIHKAFIQYKYNF